MITQEQILEKLKLERDKISPTKQVTDRYLEEKSKRLFNKVTEETVLDELVADTIEDIKDTQLTINSVLAEEAKKTKTEQKTKETKTETKTEQKQETMTIPDEMKEFMDSWKAEQKQKQINAKKEQIFNSAKGKFNDSQQAILKTVIDKFSFDFDQPDDVLQNTIIAETTNFIKATIGEVDPQKPDNKKGDGDLAAEYAKKAEQYGLIPTTNN